MTIECHGMKVKGNYGPSRMGTVKWDDCNNYALCAKNRKLKKCDF